MRIAISKQALLTAATLVALHVLAFWYVQTRDVLYDQNDVEGLLWWLVAFWVLPLLALIVLILSFAHHLGDGRNREN